jgi:hypothetical protein
MMRIQATLLAWLIMVLQGSPASAAVLNLCGAGDLTITKAGRGVELKFDPAMDLTYSINRNGRNEQITISNGVITSRSGDLAVDEDRGMLRLEPGDEIHPMVFIPHGVCGAHVVVLHGKPGLSVQTALALIGTQQYAAPPPEFYPAD